MRKLTQEEYNNTIKPLIIGDDVLKDRLCSSGYCIDEEQAEENAEYIMQKHLDKLYTSGKISCKIISKAILDKNTLQFQYYINNADKL